MRRDDEKRRTEGGGEKGNTVKRLSERVRSRLAQKSEREVRERLRAFVVFLLTAAATWLLSRAELFFGVYPLSIALCCSSRKYLPAVFTGILFSSFGGLPIIYAYTCLAVILMRILVTLVPMIFSESFSGKGEGERALILRNERAVEVADGEPCGGGELSGLRGLFCEELYLKVIVAAVGGMICGLFLMIKNDFSIYSLCSAMVLAFGTPFFALALGGIWGDARYKRRWYFIIAAGLTFFLAVRGGEGASIIGMPISPCLAMVITLYVSSSGGMLLGGSAALLCGLALEPLYAVLLVISAVLFCLVSAVKRNAGVAVVCGLVVVWCYYIGGERGLVYVLPPMLLAIPIYMLSDRYREMMSAPLRTEGRAAEGVYFAEAVTEKDKNEAVRDRLDALSDAFSSLSESFYKLSDRFRRPDVLGIKEIADSAFERVCEGCRNRERCWGAGYGETLDAVRRISSALHTKGRAETSDLPRDFVSGCVRCDRLISEVNKAVEGTTERIIKSGKANLFALNYDDVTSLLRDALNRDSEEYQCDIKKGGEIFEYLRGEGIGVGGVVVYGKRCVRVVVKGVNPSEELSAGRMSELGRKISEIVGVRLTEPVLEVGSDGGMMVLHSHPSVKAICAHGRVSSGGREWSSGGEDDREAWYQDIPENDELEICGDMTDAFITDSSYFYSLISDGMGSGSQAAYISRVSAMFIQKMLMAGNRADITLRMLNNVIRSDNMGCGDECSATVDLLELDLMSGVASFIKSGAAPTYIAREGTVYKISSRTMPVGIIKDADARITRFDTKKGDIIVMMSDGCCHDSEDCPWLVEHLCSYMSTARESGQDERTCESLRSEILIEAQKNAPVGEGRDDISVSVIIVG